MHPNPPTLKKLILPVRKEFPDALTTTVVGKLQWDVKRASQT